jgi:uncharacterized protein (DUF488 family)
MSGAELTIYTIGHGRHSYDYFLGLLRQYGVTFLCDVRSVPRSRWPQFNRATLREALRQSGIGYEHLPECGGKLLAPPDELARGLDRIIELAADACVVIMCSESYPVTQHLRQPRANCHRVGLLAVPLRARGARIIHILPNAELLECDESTLPSPWSE